MTDRSRCRVIGPGRAGSALMEALGSRGWEVLDPLRRDAELTDAAHGVELLVIATPDAVIGSVADAVTADAGAVVAHLSGAVGLDVLGTHPRRAALHPLVPLPDPLTGARRLLDGAPFAVAGEGEDALALIVGVVETLGGHWFTVEDGHRAEYHAAAVIASNHLVALLGQVERVAAMAGVPFPVYFDLVRATIDNVAELGPAAALTGPAARGDWATIERHRAALPADELELYDVLMRAARRLVDDDREPTTFDGSENGETR